MPPYTPPSGARLPFAEPERPTQIHTGKVDGASRGNPGPASYAMILRKPDGSSECEVGKYIGRATNNVAEYYGLIAALDYAASHGIARLRIQSDSELLVRQMQGRYKVKSADLKPLHERAQKLARSLTFFVIEHIPRELNSEADALANLALDRTGTVGSQSAPNTAASPTPEGSDTQRRKLGENSGKTDQEITRAKSAEQYDETEIRARYSAGALHPLQALDLSEGEVVEIRIRKSRSA